MMKKVIITFLALLGIAGISYLSMNAPTASAYTNGNLISDQIYYNYNSMSQAQIQNFINKFPNSCLKSQNSFPSGQSATWQNTTFKEPLDYFTYGTKTSPARIIYKAAQINKINPQVLIATLEKESDLISGNKGCAVWRYNSAMGYNCPDGSENALRNYADIGIYNTCVASKGNAGLSAQINHGAWQLSFDGKRANGQTSWLGDGAVTYVGRMTKGNRARVAGGPVTYYDGWTTIDGQRVYLSNGPTAALYNYTPHFNRFAAIFTDWFGTTHGYTTRGGIGARHNALGGNSGVLGRPIGPEICRDNGTSCYQSFQRGVIIWKQGIDAWENRGGIRDRYSKVGFEHGYLGYPTGGETKLAAGGAYQQFQNGRIYWKSGINAWDVRGGIKDRYLALGGDKSPLGHPIGPEICRDNGTSCYQSFQRGVIIWKQGIDAWENRGGIRDRYSKVGFEHGYLGYPTGGETKLAAGGAYQQFQNGRIYWKSGINAWDVRGGIKDRYLALGGDKSRLGYPSGSEISTTNGGKYQQFQNGRIYWKNSTGNWDIAGGIGQKYISMGADKSTLGYPKSGEKKDLNGNTYQEFENGKIFWNSTRGTWVD